MMEPKPLHISKLEACHPQYMLHSPTWRSISTLITGYTAIRKNIGRFLPLRPGEDNELYSLRVAKLAYTPLMSSVVNRYAGKLAGAEIVFPNAVDARVQTFRDSNNAPGQLNRDEKALVGDLFRHLLQYGTVWAVVDTNRLDYVVATEYDESLAKGEIRPYCYLLDPLTVTQWGDGWHITKKWKQVIAPFELPIYQMCYKYYDSNVTIEYSAEVQMGVSSDEEGNSNPVVKMVKVNGGWVPITDETCILQPSSVAYKSDGIYSVVHMDLPSEQWLCQQIYSKQIQHLQLETSWTDTGYLAGTIQRIYTPAPAPPVDDARTPYQAPDYAKELSKSGNSHILIGANYQFVESTGSAITNQQTMLDKIEEQISALSALHFSSGSQAGARSQSGVAKRLDMSLLDDTLKNYGNHVLNIYNSILDLVCEYVGVGDIQATGLDEFQAIDMDTVILLLSTVGTQPQLPPAMLLALYNKMMELANIDEVATELQPMVNTLTTNAVNNL